MWLTNFHGANIIAITQLPIAFQTKETLFHHVFRIVGGQIIYCGQKFSHSETIIIYGIKINTIPVYVWLPTTGNFHQLGSMWELGIG